MVAIQTGVNQTLAQSSFNYIFLTDKNVEHCLKCLVAIYIFLLRTVYLVC